MKTLGTLCLCLIIIFSQNVSFAILNFSWYGFYKDFIADWFSSDSAISDLTAGLFHPANTIHTISCGGKDRELHIGIALNEAQLARHIWI